MLPIKSAFNTLVSTLGKKYEQGEAKAIARLLFEELWEIDKVTLLRNPGLLAIPEQEYKSATEKLLAGEPIQYITGLAEFLGMNLSVSKAVLIPRPETEELIEWVFESCDHTSSFTDACTGSGCIALALRMMYQDAQISAFDISESALEIAKLNELSIFGNSKIAFSKMDLNENHPVSESIDVIISNPPYILAEERVNMAQHVIDYEPEIALFEPENSPLHYYLRILELFPRASEFYFELNPLTSVILKERVEKNGYQCELKKDMQGKWRFARILQAKLGSEN